MSEVLLQTKKFNIVRETVRTPAGKDKTREIIRHPGESITDFISREVSPRVASIREEAESRIDKLLRREDGTVPQAPSQGAEAAPSAGGTAGAGAGAGAELAKSSQRVFEEWQRRLDERVRHALENVTGNLPAFGRDLQQLSERLESLEKRLDDIEKKKGA